MSGRLLLVDSVAPRRALLQAGLAAARYEVAECNDAGEARALAPAAAPDLVLVDLGEETGPDAAARAARDVRSLRALSIQRHGHAAPILVLAAPDRPDLRLAALGEGAEATLDRDAGDRLLQARIRSLIRSRDAEGELRFHEASAAGALDGPLGAGPGGAGFHEPAAPSFAAPGFGAPGFGASPAALMGAPGPAFPASGRGAGGLAGPGPGLAEARALFAGPALAAEPLRATLLTTDGCGTQEEGADRLGALMLARMSRLMGRELRLSCPAPGEPGSDAADAPASGSQDLFIIDARALRDDPAASSGALRRLMDLVSHPSTRRAATALLLPAHAVETAALALDLGAGEVIAGDPSPDEAAARIAALLRRRAEGLRLRDRIRSHLEAAVRDPLTSLHNRRYAEPALHRMVERARRSGGPLTVMLLDIDHFKAVNDRWGHVGGDRVLAGVALRLRAWLPEEALVARIGGEEFLVALPDTGRAEARAWADGLRARIRARPFALDAPRGAEVRVTVSVGVATTAAGSRAPEAAELIARADAALYEAKGAGRDAVSMAPGLN